MAFISFALVHSAAGALLQDVHSDPSPYVLDYIDKMNGDCTSAHCIDELDRCADGSDPECQNRLNCIRDAGTGNAGKCLKEMKWAQLDNTEVKVLDCAHSNKCMPDEWQGQSSFLELLSKEKEDRGLSEKGEARMTAEEQAALQVVAAHLVYLEKTEEMVKRTQSMMDEVLKDKTMGIEEKIEALHMLTGHLSLLQESAKRTMAGMGMDTSDFETEEKDAEEEDELEEKMHKAAAKEEKPDEAQKTEAPEKKSEATDGKAAAAEKATEKPEAKATTPEKVQEKEKPEAASDAKDDRKADEKKAEGGATKPAKEQETKESTKAAPEKAAPTKPEAFVKTEGKTEPLQNMRTMED